MEVGPDVPESDRDYELELLIEGISWGEVDRETKLRALAYLVGVLKLGTDKCAELLDGPVSTMSQYVSELRREGKLARQTNTEKKAAASGGIRLPTISSLKRPEPKLSEREKELEGQIPSWKRK